MPYTPGSSKILIYFHANAEDIVLSHELLDYLRVLLKVNVLAVEYPGYGLYTEDHQCRYEYPPSELVDDKTAFCGMGRGSEQVKKGCHIGKRYAEIFKFKKEVLKNKKITKGFTN